MTRVRRKSRRSGAVAALAALLLIPMLALVALCVDYGYLLVVRTDLQRAADASALAAVRDLIPTPDGTQDLDQVRATVRQYVRDNVSDDEFEVLDTDIEIGRFDPATVYTNFTTFNNGIFDTVRVTIRRDAMANRPVSLFFARIIGITESEITASATAIMQKAAGLPPGSDILPIAIPQSTWDFQMPGDRWSIYGDGKILDDGGSQIPGNWGTVDIGPASNSTSALNNQISNGLSQSDLDALYSDGRINSSTEIGGDESFWANADTGLSVGIKSTIVPSHGKIKLVPIVDGTNNGNGNNLEYSVVGWGVVEITDSYWKGGPTKRHLTVTKAYMYDGDLTPHSDLSNTTNIIADAFTSPVLVDDDNGDSASSSGSSSSSGGSSSGGSSSGGSSSGGSSSGNGKGKGKGKS